MGADDDADCVEHVWRLTEVTLATDGSHTAYVCVRCAATTVVPPGGIHPQTV